MVPSFVPAPHDPATGIPLSNLERSVMQVARLDSRRIASHLRALSRLAGRLFGWIAPQRLANPVLEALRQYSVMVLIGRPVAAEEWAALLRAAGYTPARLQTIRLALTAPGTAAHRGAR